MTTIGLDFKSENSSENNRVAAEVGTVVNLPILWPHRETAARHIELLTGDPETPMCFRLIAPPNEDGSRGPAESLSPDTLAKHWCRILEAQELGWQVFIVVNEGGQSDAEITGIRALFIDMDGKPLPKKWHLEPDFLVIRDATHWHAYWLVQGMYPTAFRTAQRKLAARYGSDPAVCNPSRIMRLAGSIHLKDPGNPIAVTLDRIEGAEDIKEGIRDRHTTLELLAGLPEVSSEGRRKSTVTATADKIDRPQATQIFRRYLERYPIPPEGEGSDPATYRSIARARDLGLSDETIVDLICDATGFDPEWVWEKLNNVETYAQNEPGCDAPQTASEANAKLIENLKAAGKLSGANDEGETEEDGLADPAGTGGGKLSFAEAIALLGLDLGAASQQRVPDPPRLLMHDALMASTFDPAKYLWDGWILAHEVNLIYGDGKTGKTMLSLHLAVARAAGKDLFGKKVQSGPALIVTTEDNFGPIKHAVRQICEGLEVDPLSPLAIAYSCRPRIDTTLAEIAEDGSWQPGMFLRTVYEDLAELTAAYGECLVILDPLVNFATLNENLRPAAHTLCQTVLPGYCDYLGATVVVDAHPSAQQMRTGRGGSGSTGWRNAVRNLLLLEKDDPLDELDPARTLRSGGSNYGSPERLHLTLDGPVFSINRDWQAPHKLTEPERAAIFLSEMLQNNDAGMTMEELVEQAEGRLINESALRRAVRDKLVPVEPRRVLGAEHSPWRWHWVTSEPKANEQEDSSKL